VLPSKARFFSVTSLTNLLALKCLAADLKLTQNLPPNDPPSIDRQLDQAHCAHESRKLSRARLTCFRGKLPEVGETSRLWQRKGEDTMMLTLAGIVGALMFALCVIVSSTPLLQIEQTLESLAR